jgi:type IV pilus assembly protein PilA
MTARFVSGSYTLRNAMRKQKGFSLIELLMVVAIILIITAIAIPNLLRSRMAANESSAAASIRDIVAAETAYSFSYPHIGYANQLQDLGRTEPCTPLPAHACLLDDNLALAVPGTTGHSGYQFLATGISSGSAINSDYVAGGTPLSASQTGDRDFCAISDGALRNQPSTGGLPPVTVAPCAAYPVAQ